MKRFFYHIDIVGSCNLRCPSCPQGNSPVRLSRHLMSLDMFQQIVAKATQETFVAGIGLFNWTEPLLHPQCSQFVRVCREAGIPVHLSTNLNNIRNLPDVLRESPTSIRLSISGATQEVYGRTHKGGNIQRVEQNMGKLHDMISMLNCDTKIDLLWHRYRHNTSDEPVMRAMCSHYGFRFKPIEAYLMPLELVLARWDGDEPKHPVEELLWTPLELAKQRCQKSRSCYLQERQIAIDAFGDAHLCCALFDPALSRVGPFLELTNGQIQKAKFKSDTCSRCIAAGGHNYATYQWKLWPRVMKKLGDFRALASGL